VSSTNRGGRRSPADNYATPAWCVERLLEARTFPPGSWLEPAAGNGAIVTAVNRTDVDWRLWEIRSEERARLAEASPGARVRIGDFIRANQEGELDGQRFAVAITNPPFSLAQDFIDACLAHSDTVVMLLRLNYLASKTRFDFMSTNTPDVYVLPTRPSFSGGTTDSVEYAWFVWGRGKKRRGTLRILNLK